MINPKDAIQQQMLEAVVQLSLSREQLALAEGYLSGEKDEEVLTAFGFQDISAVLPNPFWQIFENLRHKGRLEEAGRFFELLFAIGQSTCYPLVPPDILVPYYNKQDVFECDAAKKAAVYGAMIGMEQGQLNIKGTVIRDLIKLADRDPETIKKAIDYQKNLNADGRLILHTAYFITKYKDLMKEFENKEKALEQPENAESWNNIEQMYDIAIASEDIPLMQEYENIILSGLNKLFQNQLSEASIQQITDAIVQDQITGTILDLAGSVHVYKLLLNLYGGMAYLGFPFSLKLKNIVKVCLATQADVWSTINGEDMLNTIMEVSNTLAMDIRWHGGFFSRIFGIDSEEYIRWAAMKQCRSLLKRLFQYDRESYLKIMDGAELETANIMTNIVKYQEPDLYAQLEAQKKDDWKNRDKEKLIDLLIGDDFDHIDLVKSYLRGEQPVDILYPFIDKLGRKYHHNGAWIGDHLRKYTDKYEDNTFYRRAQAYMLLKHSYCFWGESEFIDSEQGIKTLFEGFALEHVAVSYQLSGLDIIYEYVSYNESGKNVVVEGAAEYFADYLKQHREETIHAFSTSTAFVRFFGLHVLRKAADENKKEILSYSQDSAKIVKQELLDILYEQTGWEEEIKSLLSSKKAAERELAITVLSHWQGEGTQYQAVFAQALEKEKNNKVRSLLEGILKLEGTHDGASGEAAMSREDLVKELHKGNRKRTLAWAYETPFSAVHFKSGGAATEEYLQAVLMCYSHVDGCGVSKKAAFLAEELRPEEFALYVNELFDKWLESGAEAKKKWVLYAASIHGGAAIIQKMHHQIQEWPQYARGAIASEAVQALTLNPLPQALLIVDGIARKFKFKQIKAAAQNALEFAANQLGISREELADRIVPNLGFDEKMERHFDYGERSFRVTITPALEIEVFDDSGKKLKNMPAPGKKDDEQKAAAAYEEFKQMKKQMKLTITSQKQRLEMALSTAREWTVEAWEALFVKNPIMHQFAIGLLWGVYQDRKLVQSFRYMEDGSFNTEDEDEYQLPVQGQIGLVHPIELSKESKEAWRQQLEDYEITQPIDQLERSVYTITEEEAASQQLERFGGYIMNDLSLCGKLQNLGWYRGSTEDAGGFYTFYREDMEVGLGVELHFSGTYIGCMNEDVTIYDARFYKAGTIERGNYMYEEAGKEQAYFLGEVPERYFSEIVWQLTKATATSQGRNEDWRKEARAF